MDTPPYSDVANSPSGSALTAVDNHYSFATSRHSSFSHLPHMRSILLDAANDLDHPNPPSLRDILAAYKHKGDGDREMLLAMLDAKSAEDKVSPISIFLPINFNADPLSPAPCFLCLFAPDNA